MDWTPAEVDAVADRAVKLFIGEGCNCAVSVSTALAEALGRNAAEMRVLALPFGAGTSYTGLTCGAVSGAVLALGLANLGSDPTDPALKPRIYMQTAALVEAFRRRFAEVRCIGLLGLDLARKEDQRRFAEQELREKVCRPAVEHAARLAALSIAGRPLDEA